MIRYSQNVLGRDWWAEITRFPRDVSPANFVLGGQYRVRLCWPDGRVTIDAPSLKDDEATDSIILGVDDFEWVDAPPPVRPATPFGPDWTCLHAVCRSLGYGGGGDKACRDRLRTAAATAGIELRVAGRATYLRREDMDRLRAAYVAARTPGRRLAVAS